MARQHHKAKVEVKSGYSMFVISVTDYSNEGDKENNRRKRTCDNESFFCGLPTSAYVIKTVNVYGGRIAKKDEVHVSTMRSSSYQENSKAGV